MYMFLYKNIMVINISRKYKYILRKSTLQVANMIELSIRCVVLPVYTIIHHQRESLYKHMLFE